MPTIQEEQGVRSEDQLGDFFDFGGAAEPQVDVSGNRPDANATLSNTIEPAIQSAASTDQPNGPEPSAEDYARLQDWIPRFVRPDEPCGYCRSKHLNCFLSYGKLTCTACDALFRPCSFANVDNHDHGSGHDSANNGVLETLHPVTEDICQEQGAMSSTHMLKSKSTVDDKKSNPRFSRAAVKVLKDWVDSHNDNPYPSEEEKAELGRLTGLRYGQLNTWFANARRRGKVGRGRPKGAMSPSLRHSSPVGIPSSNIEVMNWENMNPLERWKHSPPMNEPAPIHAIKDALVKNELPPLESLSSSPLGYTGLASSRGESGPHVKSISPRRALSMTSVEQLVSESGTSSAAWSGSHESFGSFSSFGSSLHGKKDRRRRRRGTASALKQKGADNSKRIFQCTFCTDTFKSKYDWTRHEKSLHLPLEKFICCPLGPRMTDSATGEERCAYCLSPNPTTEHLETHGHQNCVEKGREARTFLRKDHLRQHLKLAHGSQLLPHMEAWMVEAKFINSRCGFCSQRFTVWQERVDHIAAHFKAGKRMIEWKGCRGLDPKVAASVWNAMPPYLIGTEQTSLDPFSATSTECSPFTVAVPDNKRSPATRWEILTVRLGRFAKEEAEKGVLLTDEMLQSQARLLLYDDPDPWNQTAADNPEWLDLFKRAHGLDYLPNIFGGQGNNVPEDLELYGDLGVRIPFSLQLAHGVTEDIPSQTARIMAEARAARTAQTLSPALPISHGQTKQIETFPAPCLEAGGRDPVIYNEDMGDAHRGNRLLTFAHLGMMDVSFADDSGPAARHGSTTAVISEPSLEPYNVCDPSFLDTDCMLSCLGVDMSARDTVADNTVRPVAIQQQQQQQQQQQSSNRAQEELKALNAILASGATWFGQGRSNNNNKPPPVPLLHSETNNPDPQQAPTDGGRAQEELDALNASLAVATTAPQPADASACCFGSGHCSNPAQVFPQLYADNTLDPRPAGGHGANDSGVATAAASVMTGGQEDVGMNDFELDDVCFDKVGVEFGDVDFALFDAPTEAFGDASFYDGARVNEG